MTSPLLLPTGSVVQLRPPSMPAIQAAPPSGTVPVIPVPGLTGQQGPPGTSGDNAQAFNEALSGVKNGVNAVFTTAVAFTASSTRVYRNGLREHLDYSYSESGPSEITFDEPPLPADDISIDYLIA